MGKGVSKAVDNVNTIIAPALIVSISRQFELLAVFRQVPSRARFAGHEPHRAEGHRRQDDGA
jgi:hypothetical protein